MSNPPFLIGESIRFGWRTLRAHSALVFEVVLTLLGLQVAQSIVAKVLAHTALGLLSSIVLTILLVVAGIGATLIALKLARDEAAVYGDLVVSWSLLVRYILSQLLAGVAVFAPLLVGGLLILSYLAFFGTTHVPGQVIGVYSGGVGGILGMGIVGLAALATAIYFALRFSLARFAVLDGARPKQSLEKSAVRMRGAKWRMLGFVVVIVGLNIVGALALLVGLLVTIPISTIAYAHVYLQLKAHVEAKS